MLGHAPAILLCWLARLLGFTRPLLSVGVSVSVRDSDTTQSTVVAYCLCLSGGNRCSDSQSTAGRDGLVHDFLAGSGRVNRNSSDVLELGYSSGNLRKQKPDAIVPMTSGVVAVGQKGGRGRGHCKFLTKF